MSWCWKRFKSISRMLYLTILFKICKRRGKVTISKKLREEINQNFHHINVFLAQCVDWRISILSEEAEDEYVTITYTTTK